MRDGRRNGKEEREGEQKKKEGGKNLVETRSKEKTENNDWVPIIRTPFHSLPVI